MREVQAEIDGRFSDLCFEVTCLADSLLHEWSELSLDQIWLQVPKIDRESLLN